MVDVAEHLVTGWKPVIIRAEYTFASVTDGLMNGVAMTPEQELFSRTLFRLRVHEAEGVRYQALFVAVMQKRHADFRPVKPMGRKGDKGNDGYLPGRGAYFQVFAPENPGDRVPQAIKKAKDDFNKLLAGWADVAPIREYYFAFNDKFRGTSEDLDRTLNEIQGEHGLRVAAPFLAKDLMAEFLQLPEGDRSEILGGVIPRASILHDIEFHELTEILQHVVDARVAPSWEALRTVPDIEEKIRFNGLSSAVAHLLFNGAYQAGVIEEYFRRTASFSRADIRNRLNGMYLAAVDEMHNNGGDPDETFFLLWERIMPNSEVHAREAALALMAFYFEACDIFQHP